MKKRAKRTRRRGKAARKGRRIATVKQAVNGIMALPTARALLLEETMQTHLDTVIQGIADGITVQSPDSRLLYANQAAAELIGYTTVDELLKTPIKKMMRNFRLMGEDGKPLAFEELPGRKALQGNRSEKLVGFRPNSGEERWSLVRATPVKNNRGKVLYAINIFHDVTDRKRELDQEHFLAKASDLLASSLDYETTLKSIARLAVPYLADWCTVYIKEEGNHINQLAIAHKNPRLVAFAREYANLFPTDYNASGGIGAVIRLGKSDIVSYMPPEIFQQEMTNKKQLRMIRQLNLTSYMAVPLKARGRTLGAIAFLMTNDRHRYSEADLKFAQEVGHRAALAIDNARLYQELRVLNRELEQKVRERTRELQEAQMQDRANLQRLKDMISNMPMAAVAADEHVCILHTNQLFCDLFSLGKPQDIIGKDGLQLLDKAKDVFAYPDLYANALIGILERKREQSNVELMLNDGRMLLCDYIPIFEKRKHRGHLLLYRDITQEKRIDASKTEFMSLASHQLRTPLTAIRWSFGRIKRTLPDSVDPQTQKVVTEGMAAAERMAQTIDTMLSISRIESGNVKPTVSTIHLANFLADMVHEHKNEYEQKKQRVRIICSNNLTVRSDANLLHEILQNLFGNSIKYSPDHASISIKVKRETNAICVDLIDTGFGIPLRQQEKIFTKFFRGDNVVQRVTEGTGLGLYLVSLLAKTLGGSVTFVSKEGKGSTFTLRVPDLE